jgi:hypothetical protein
MVMRALLARCTEHVAVEHDERLVAQARERVANASAGAEQRRLAQTSQGHVVRASERGQRRLDLLAEMVGVGDHMTHADRREAIERIGRERTAQQRHQRFRSLERQRTKPRPEPCAEEHRVHGGRGA